MRKPALVIAALGLCLSASAVSANVVNDWNLVLINAIRTDATNPPKASRHLAMVHTAVFDAVNALEGMRYQAYETTGPGPSNASSKAAAAAAAHRVLVHLYPAQTATFDAQLALSLQGIPLIKKIRGQQWGVACANAIIALRATDGSGTVIPYTPPVGPGYWIPTPAAFAPALLPNWGNTTPWTLEDGAQFLAPGPPALTTKAYTVAFNEVKSLGAVNSVTRTAEQTQIALFWADGGGTETPPGHWNTIARGIALDEGLSVLETARLFAMLNVSQADAAIACWDSKYFFNHWRPVTGIRAADTDGNPFTAQDATWSSLIATPPFPSYTSGHSTFSGAAATVLGRFFGTDTFSFESTSNGLPGVTRSFTGFMQAANEAADSRLYGGIHWRYDNQDGLDAGVLIGNQVADEFFGRLGDLDGDDDVDVFDLIILLGEWGMCGCDDCPADLNQDGRVGLIDLLILIHNLD